MTKNIFAQTAAAGVIAVAAGLSSVPTAEAQTSSFRNGGNISGPIGTTPGGTGGTLPGGGCNGNPSCGGGGATPPTGGGTVIKNNNSNAVNVQQKNTNNVAAAYLVPSGSCGTGFTLAVAGWAAGGFTWQDKGCKAGEAALGTGVLGAQIHDNTLVAVSLASLGEIYAEIGHASKFVAETIVKCGPSTKTASPVLTANGICETYSRSASKPRRPKTVVVQADPVAYKPVCVLVPVTKTPEPVCRPK